MNPFIGASSTFQMFSASTLFSLYASITALFTLIQQFYHQFVPKQVRNYISLRIEEWFSKSSSSTTLFTLVIEQFEDGDFDSLNQVYYACEAYLASKLKSTSSRLKVSRRTKKDLVSFKLAQGEKYSEEFKGMKVQWSFINDNAPNCKALDGEDSRSYGTQFANKFFELSVDPDLKDRVFESYLPYILKYYDQMAESKKDLLLYSLDCGFGKPGSWRSVKFKHPFTFDALAMEPEVKGAVIDDLNRFINRREFYRKIGRAWKRGYLLYGPPGTGKSSLIAAMANHLKFDVYDLQLSSVHNDSALRRLLLSTTNKSILVIEDIDCSLGLADRQLQIAEGGDGHANNGSDVGSQISLSGLLNFIDGLWSSCGDERIFIFTTNHKDKLDPALLRPGRMDMHIHMSYLTISGFKILASNYLNLSGDDHHLYGEIAELLEMTDVTPAQVAEELIRNDSADIALSGLVDMLKEKKMKGAHQKRIRRWGYECAQPDSGEDAITDEFSSD